VSEFLLLGTSHCALCDQAEDVLASVIEEFADATVYTVDIAEDSALVETYGDSIPVIISSALGSGLYWPFDAELLREFLNAGLQE
jgi:thiol-disulfide isomerase/thioredoxin